MNASKDVAYRIALAGGFLSEAEQDFTLERWRSCVDNAQLAVENAGKAALALFGIAPKTHDPARQIAAILREQELPANVSELLHAMLPDLLVWAQRRIFSRTMVTKQATRCPGICSPSRRPAMLCSRGGGWSRWRIRCRT